MAAYLHRTVTSRPSPCLSFGGDVRCLGTGNHADNVPVLCLEAA